MYVKDLYDVIKANPSWLLFGLSREEVLRRLRYFLAQVDPKKRRYYLRFFSELKDPEVQLSYLREAGDLIEI